MASRSFFGSNALAVTGTPADKSAQRKAVWRLRYNQHGAQSVTIRFDRVVDRRSRPSTVGMSDIFRGDEPGAT